MVMSLFEVSIQGCPVDLSLEDVGVNFTRSEDGRDFMFNATQSFSMVAKLRHETEQASVRIEVEVI